MFGVATIPANDISVGILSKKGKLHVCPIDVSKSKTTSYTVLLAYPALRGE